MTQNIHICTICCRPEVVYDVISGRNVQTMERYIAINFEVAIYIALMVSEIFKKNNFVTAAAEAAEADIDDSIRRKRFRVSLTKAVAAGRI